jgi:hypothetical protein
MSWQTGRQGTGYSKFNVARGKTWDCWLLHYPPDTGIPPHTDPVEGKKHYRINIVLLGDRDAFETDGTTIFSWKGIVVFRPDLNSHSVIPTDSTRVVFSFGWVQDS